LWIFAGTALIAAVGVWFSVRPQHVQINRETDPAVKAIGNLIEEPEIERSHGRGDNAAIAGMGKISGVILFDGQPPDPGVRNVMTLTPVPDESLLVDKQTGGIANALIFLPTAPEGTEFNSAMPAEAAAVHISDSRIEPLVMIVGLGQPIEVTNDQAKSQLVSTFSVFDKQQIVNLDPAGKAKIAFQKPGQIPNWLECSCEWWKRVYTLVLDHPFGAVSGRTGKFEIENLPPGTHSLRIWHERAGWLEKDYAVTVLPGRESRLTVKYPASRFTRHPNSIPGSVPGD
jgi:hypothetical protein